MPAQQMEMSATQKMETDAAIKEKLNKLENAKSDEGPPAKKPKNECLWKLVKAKFMLSFRMCDDCYGALFNNQEVTVRQDDNKVQIKFFLCNKCVEVNSRATDLLAPPKKK